MRYGVTVFAFFLITLLGTQGFVQAEGQAGKKKEYPHPHTLHMEARSERSTDFVQEDISDWPGLARALNARLKALPFSPEAVIVINNLKPDSLSSDDKAVVTAVMNRLLSDEKFFAQSKAGMTDEIKRLEAEYRKTKSPQDLKFLNRAVLNAIFPQTARISKVKELKNISCGTCHETEEQAIKALLKGRDISEKSVLDCFSKALADKRLMEECIEEANILKKAKIEDYGPLKNFIQRKDAGNGLPFFVAVHPEDPYTFKPLLKRLVCLECHSAERKTDKVIGRDGKVKEIPIFYGAGSEKQRRDN